MCDLEPVHEESAEHRRQAFKAGQYISNKVSVLRISLWGHFSKTTITRITHAGAACRKENLYFLGPQSWIVAWRRGFDGHLCWPVSCTRFRVGVLFQIFCV